MSKEQLIEMIVQRLGQTGVRELDLIYRFVLFLDE